MKVSRRQIIKLMAASAASISIGGTVTKPTMAQPQTFDPSFFLDFQSNGKITVKITRSELGQGVQTGLAQIVADELGAKWSDIESVIWPYSKESDHLPEDYDGAGGSMSVRLLWTPLRTAAAALREMLLTAAANRWQVDVSSCSVRDSLVLHENTGRALKFADLYLDVQNAEMPANPRLKEVGEFEVIGKPQHSLGNREVVTGVPRYSIDQHLSNMLVAVIVRPPVRGAKLVGFDASGALQVPGVKNVFAIDPIEQTGDPIEDWETNYRGVVGGVAVLASSSWAAIKGRKALVTQWAEGRNAERNSQGLQQELLEATTHEGTTVWSIGDVDTAFSQAEKIYDQTYVNPFQASAPLEPLNAIAHVEGRSCTIWAGTQSQSFTARYIADVLGLDRDKMTVHVHPSGGGFGRRYFYDFMTEAVLISQKSGKPVQLLWTREDDIKHVRAHPARAERHRVALNENNFPIAYESVAGAAKGDPYGVYGLFNPYSYGCEHVRDKYSYGPERLIDVGSWRSVSAHWQSLTRECFIDEIATDLGEDPVSMRLRWLEMPILSTNDPERIEQTEAGRVRARHVLKRAAGLVNWEEKRDREVPIGISLDRYGNTWVSHVVELGSDPNDLQIKQITCVFDCGLVVNPQLVEAQIEGSLVWALQPILFSPITVEQGRVLQSNFDAYEMPRMSDIPDMQIEIVQSDMSPSGAGEPAVPGLAPAVLNAYFSLAGIRKRSLPLMA